MIGILSTSAWAINNRSKGSLWCNGSRAISKEVSEFDREQRDAVDAQLFRNK